MEKGFTYTIGVYFWKNGENHFVGQPTTDERDIVEHKYYRCIDTEAHTDEFYNDLANTIMDRYSKYNYIYISNKGELRKKSVCDEHYHDTYTWYIDDKQISSKEAFLLLAIMLTNKE